jgi:hypothetical protein
MIRLRDKDCVAPRNSNITEIARKGVGFMKIK